MKFACRGEMTAPPIRYPFSPQLSSMRPAPSSPGGFLKTEPKVRLFVGCVALRRATRSATVALDLARRAAATRRYSTARDDLTGRELGVPVREAELVRRQPAAPVAPRRRARARGSRAQSAAVGAGVHPHAAAGRARDRAGELEAAEPADAGAVEADRVRRAAARARSVAVDLDRRELPRETDDERVDAVVRGEQVRAEPDRRDRHVALGRPARAPPRARRATPAARRQRAGPPVPIVVSLDNAGQARFACASCAPQRRRGARHDRARGSPGLPHAERHDRRRRAGRTRSARCARRRRAWAPSLRRVGSADRVEDEAARSRLRARRVARADEVGHDRDVGEPERVAELPVEMARSLDDVRDW